MARTDRTLCLDIGASKLVLAEFSTRRGVAPELTRYVCGRLGVEPETDADASPYIVSTIRELMREAGVKPGPVLVSISGQAVFPRYVKLPAVAGDKIAQMVQYEAEQNLPFPIEEVVWDYELLGDATGEELHVMVVAAKTDIVSRLTDCVTAAGLDPELVDVGTMALYNATRYNYPDLTGCTMILDIGARSSNLIFLEDSKIFSRSIPVAGNAITTEIMKEFELPFKDAEDLKKAHASVALGGVSGSDESEVGSSVAKIVRNIVTRLHAEVNRSINFYRSQQQGTAPSRVLLTGGSSVIPHMDTFFREKLRVEVEYLNPFVNVTVGSKVDTGKMAGDLHILGEVSGLSLRRTLECPVEISLLPPSLVEKKAFRKRQPFLALSAVGVIVTLVCWWVYASRASGMFSDLNKEFGKEVKSREADGLTLGAATGQRTVIEADAEQVRDLIQLRSEWLLVLDAVHERLLDGMWLTAITPTIDADGVWTGFKISGAAFSDDVVALAKEGPESDVIEGVCAKLRDCDLFDPAVTQLKTFSHSADDTTREFTIEVGLKKALNTGKPKQ